MHFGDILILLLSGFGGGVINSVAGGGALVIFPLLISMGVTPKLANTTTSVGVFGGQVGSAYGYKKFIKSVNKRLFIFLAIGLVGGTLGALALDRTSDKSFENVAPWFVLIAVVLLALQPMLSQSVHLLNQKTGVPKTAVYLFLCAIAFIVSIYGGYFGIGMGIIIFALLSFTGMKNVNQINGLKNLMTIAINGAANTYFILSGLVRWDMAICLLIGSAAGGYIGSKTASRLPANVIRGFVIVAGLVATIVLFRR